MKLFALLVTLLPALAAADVPRIVMTPANQDDLRYARQVLPATGNVALAASRTIYLNHKGVSLSVGANDSRTNTSTIVTHPAVIPPWNTDAGTWYSTVTCVRDLFSPFDVTVTDVDPGNVPHIEAVFGGSPTTLGLASNIGGISPFTQDCSIIENSMVFAFMQTLPNDSRLACEIMAQEIAHSFGLDHEMLASDPMTYLAYDGERAFENIESACGEDHDRPCGIDGSTCRAKQNSVRLLSERLGVSTGDVSAPVLGITSPANHAIVPPGFEIHASASDDKGVKSAQMFIDGMPLGTPSTGAGPFLFFTPQKLTEGSHVVKIEVSDGKNLESQTITVTVQVGAPPPVAPDDTASADLIGGCSSSGGSSGWLALLGLAHAISRATRSRHEAARLG